MNKSAFDLRYYDGTANLLHNNQLISIMLNPDLSLAEKSQFLQKADLNFIIDNCLHSSMVFNQITELIGQILLEREEINQHAAPSMLRDNELLQLAGNLFTLIGGMRASTNQILNQAITMRLSD